MREFEPGINVPALEFSEFRFAFGSIFVTFRDIQAVPEHRIFGLGTKISEKSKSAVHQLSGTPKFIAKLPGTPENRLFQYGVVNPLQIGSNPLQYTYFCDL